MKKLFSLPPLVVGAFNDIAPHNAQDSFCASDPAERKLGSGGGTAWLLASAHRAEAPHAPFAQWLKKEKRILLHAGGHSRRLPAYAPSGKVLTPIPVFRWERGQRLGQNLLDLQVPLYKKMLHLAPKGIHTLIASGDVLLRATDPIQEIPEADVVCYGLWGDPAQASHHGVFLMNRQHPAELDFMLQKPSPERQAELMQTHLLLMDIGVWLLSDRAVERLMAKAAARYAELPEGDAPQAPAPEDFETYDLYSEFGCGLGLNPSSPDPALSDLSVAVLPLPGGEFYHFGTNRDMIESTMAIQNLVKDQRYILRRGIKPQGSVFTQNCVLKNSPTAKSRNIWVENSFVGEGWQYSFDHILTGIPRNDWHVSLKPGVCIDMVPVGEEDFALRPYGFPRSG